MLQSNIWWIKGDEHDVVIDAGLGITPLRPQLPEMFDQNPQLIVTHTHLDHIGGAHEFEDIAVHVAEATTLTAPGPTSLRTRVLSTFSGSKSVPRKMPRCYGNSPTLSTTSTATQSNQPYRPNCCKMATS
ncbi:MBL fold metallo-hydrolase [Arthrobacter sp. fls2-241-R2A-172]|uniref:MBL fold metallo-hydrolase n=1 Tax=Arthrobacter sp. fls2-241-R2A-172 TaxID=3040325 RepID=UPI0033075527